MGDFNGILMGFNGILMGFDDHLTLWQVSPAAFFSYGIFNGILMGYFALG